MPKRSFSPANYRRAVFSARDHVLVDRKGNLWVGKVENKTFTIKTEFQTVTLQRKKIQSIVYKNEPTYDADVITTLDATVLKGVVRPPETILFKPAASSDVLVFPIAAVLSLVFAGS